MIIYEYLMKAIQDDARRADERNRLLLEARRPRRAPRQRLVGFRAGGWIGLIGNSPQLAKLALDQALAAGAFLRGRRSYEWLAARWPSRSGELADRTEQPAQVRRVRDPRQSRLEQPDSPQGRRA